MIGEVILIRAASFPTLEKGAGQGVHFVVILSSYFWHCDGKLCKLKIPPSLLAYVLPYEKNKEALLQGMTCFHTQNSVYIMEIFYLYKYFEIVK